MPRTLGLMTRLCLPPFRSFSMTVTFLGLYTYSAVTRLFVLVPTYVGCVWRLPMYISALLCTLGTLSEFSSVPILVADELAQNSLSCETRS